MRIALIALGAAGGVIVAGTGALLGYLAHLDRQDDRHDAESVRKSERRTGRPADPGD